jgi:predicted DNA-binding transcriptional regulator YafY
MLNEALYVTDPDGDAISVEKSGRTDAVAYIDIETRQNDGGAVVLSKKDALRVAAKLIELAGGNVVPVADLKLASDLSFNEAVLRVAAAHKRTVTFRYAKDSGDYIEARRLNPEKIVGEGDSLAALGTDPDRGGPRRFRLDRIKGEVSFA